jgi:hypothetical protein
MSPVPTLANLSATVPIALLPVRIETRFMNGATELRVRVYPDPLHIETHEPELTSEEVAAGRSFWTERWAAPADSSRTTAAWNELVRAFQPRRALWVVHTLRPVNVAQLGQAVPIDFPQPASKPSAWTRAAFASLLPDQWVVVGIRNGVEVFRKAGGDVADRIVVGPDPDAESAPAAGDSLPVDDAMRWLVDYDSAVKLGMGITVTNADVSGGLAGGVDQLIVLGVATTLTPDQGAGALADVLRAHVYSDGLSMVRPGSPTNNTEAARTGDPDPIQALARELDPAVPRALGADSGGRALEHAFGLPVDAAHLANAGLSTLSEQPTTSLLIDVVWSSTLGYYLDQLMDPLVDDLTITQLRDYAKRFLQPGGPLPVLRTGKQPYGILPVVSFTRFSPNADIERKLHAVLKRLRPFWESAARQVPRLGATGDADTELLQLLQMSPVSAAARFRRVFGPELEPNTQGLELHAMAQQYYAALVTQLALGWAGTPRVTSFTLDPRDHPLRVPWVQQDTPDDAPLEPNYLAEIAQVTRSNGGRALLNERDHADALLQALAANAALNEFDVAAARVVNAHQVQIGAAPRASGRASFRAPEAVRIAGPTPPPSTPGVAGPVSVDTPGELSDLVLPAMTGKASVGTWIATRVRAAGTPPVSLKDLASFLSSLDDLATRPAGEIDRALRGVLDAYSHRLDAWLTSLATARLAALRTQRPLGLYLGGYGWVEGLHPDTEPDSLGYLHAPSLAQASAAAMLRSGHLAHRDSEHQTMNIDLRSDRVRLALGILEGVAQGQPLAALLGYRIERALRDRDPRLARFIAPLRQLAPLRPVIVGEVTQPTEAIAARDVVDGVALLEQWRTSENAVLNAIGVTSAERGGVTAELRRLADTLDAVSDLLVAESVYQTAAGNPERARAALAVLDRQERPVDLQVVRTPRTGATYTQRLIVVMTEEAPPAAWARLVDARSAAEPRLNAWLARVLGAPSRYRFAGRVVTDNKPPRSVQLTLAQLALSPLSLVLAARRGGPDQASELEERIVLGLAAGLLADDVNPRLEIEADPPAGVTNVLGLGPLLVLLDWLGKLVGQRAADARDFALPEDTVAPATDVTDLAARADAAVATFNAALAAIEAALRPAKPVEKTLRAALTRAAAAGTPHAVPSAIVKMTAGSNLPADALTTLASRVELARNVRTRMQATKAVLAGLDTALAAGPQPPGAQALADHQVARVRAVFGTDFPLLPRFVVANAEDLTPSLNEQAALCAGDRLAPLAWLQRMALVRPDTDTFQRVLTATELLGGSVAAADFRIVQLPHTPGQRWAALPLAAGATMTADLALALHAPGVLDFTLPLAGLVCDGWTETIPDAEETTGLAFHYDAPGSRAANSVLLAVPADAAARVWSFDELLDVVHEAVALTRIRLVGPRQLPALGILLPTTYLPDNSRRDVPSVKITQLAGAVAASTILGKTS